MLSSNQYTSAQRLFSLVVIETIFFIDDIVSKLFPGLFFHSVVIVYDPIMHGYYRVVL